MEVRFYFTVNTECQVKWCNVLHIGYDGVTYRLPGIWIHGGSNQFYISMSNNIEGGDPAFFVTTFSVLADNQQHLFHFKFNQTHKIVYIDNVEHYNVNGNFLNTNYQNVYPIYLSNINHGPPADMNITDMCIYSNAQQPTSSPTFSP
eukprot:249449_1